MKNRKTRLAALLLLGLAACAMDDQPLPSGRGPERLMAWPDLLERPRPEPDRSISYGQDPLQRVDLWRPSGPGPHPVVLMVHGGCWQTEIADRTIMNWISADLRGRGIAVWNVDYRGVDRPGGGYPGTFLDVAAAADALKLHAAPLGLDTDRVVAVGHSAGGHLALWLAARHRLPPDSPLRRGTPLAIPHVVSLGGLPDLELAAKPPGSGCGTDIIARLTDGHFADTSVPRLAPIGAVQQLVNGRQDRIIPNVYAEDYQAKMRAAGDRVDVQMVDRTGHVELIAPDSRAWAMTVEAIQAALRRPAREGGR